MIDDSTPGWYGKLPTLGDFASRRLGADFIEAWDLWLGDRLAGLKEQLGESWLQSYLDSPVWRFVLLPGALGEVQGRPIAGVLMASVDRVGRYFPLTLVQTLPREPADAPELEALMAWLHQLEDVAVDALQDDFSIDQLDQALALLPPPLPPLGQSGFDANDAHAPVRRELAMAMEDFARFVDLGGVPGRSEQARLIAEAVAGSGRGNARPHLARRAYWLCEGDAGTRLLVTLGMPSRESFIGLFGAGASSGPDAAADPGLPV